MGVSVAVSAHLLDLLFDFSDFLVAALTSTHHLTTMRSNTSLAGGDWHDAY